MAYLIMIHSAVPSEHVFSLPLSFFRWHSKKTEYEKLATFLLEIGNSLQEFFDYVDFSFLRRCCPIVASRKEKRKKNNKKLFDFTIYSLWLFAVSLSLSAFLFNSIDLICAQTWVAAHVHVHLSDCCRYSLESYVRSALFLILSIKP